MENTIENKAKLFAQYYGSKASIYSTGYWNECSYEYVYNVWLREDSFILLTSLSDITDDDAIEVAKIENNYDDPLMKGRWLIANMFDKCPDDFHPMFIMETVDYLRSRGHALPWMGVSVEEQIKRGWIKLKTK